jgi:hypothetical protein
MWMNDYYLYNPATNSRSALYSPDYSYDCGSQVWTKTTWNYSAASGGYTMARVTTDDPGLATGCPAVPSQTASAGGGTDSTGTNGVNNGLAANSSATGSGPGSTSGSTLNGSNNTAVNNNTSAAMNNTITSVAGTGSSLVLGNTTAGGAATGNAQDITNVVNMLQSSSNALGTASNLIVFQKDINGDVNGDLLLDPNMLGLVQPASNSNVGLDNTLTVNTSTDASINNNINLAANTGDATVANNTTAGDAQTGTATAVANVVNMINSIITSGKSFLGIININGNLNGDILLPPDFVDQLLAANVPTVTLTVPVSTNTDSTGLTDTTTVHNTNNLGINNTVTASATSGSADVTGNTTGGTARTGQATTKVTAFNLTGSQVIGANALLVFVNVQGQWVGMIVNAPNGTTAAGLGGDITNNTVAADNDTTVNNNVTEQINNTITVNARSGDALVHNNTTGGNATSGDARTAVNLFNVENSSLAFTGWFGLLFINVFGTWHGSFGMNTAAGNPIASGPGAGESTQILPQVFAFVPNSGAGGTSGTVKPYTSFANAFSGTSSGSNGGAESSSDENAVLAASTDQNTGVPAPRLPEAHSNLGTKMVVIGGLVVFYILADAYITHRRSLRTA